MDGTGNMFRNVYNRIMFNATITAHKNENVFRDGSLNLRSSIRWFSQHSNPCNPSSNHTVKWITNKEQSAVCPIYEPDKLTNSLRI